MNSVIESYLKTFIITRTKFWTHPVTEANFHTLGPTKLDIWCKRKMKHNPELCDYNSPEFSAGYEAGINSRPCTPPEDNQDSYIEGWIIGEAEKDYREHQNRA